MSHACDSSPLPPFIGAVALVRRMAGNNEEWLTLWDAELNAYRLVQADRGEGETYRSCLGAAIESELGLEHRDYIVSSLSRAHYQAPVEWPGELFPQWVLVQFFMVELYGREARERIDQASGLRWFTMDEVARGRSSEGDPFSERQRLLLDRAGVIPAGAGESTDETHG